MSLADLTHGAGAQLLAELADHDPDDTLALTTRLRARGFEPALVAEALTQARLRQRALPRWGDLARTWWFTPPGLEQATRPVVAARHAQRYVRGGFTAVTDLCCGVGSDAWALEQAGVDVTSVDLDAAACEAARLNLAGPVLQQDALLTSLGPAAFVDPSRRSGRSRTYDPQAWSPPLDAVLALRTVLGLKVAPGIDHDAVPAGWQAEWVSVDGDVLEAGLWSPPLADDGVGRSALLLARDGSVVAQVDDRGMQQAEVGPVGEWLHEPDGAVIRAGLVAQLGGRLVDPTIAYLTSDGPLTHPALTSYRVLDVVPFGLKSLRTYLRDRGVGILTVKKRGTAVEPEQLRKQLRLSGPATATIVLTRVAGQQSVLVVEPAHGPTGALLPDGHPTDT